MEWALEHWGDILAASLMVLCGIGITYDILITHKVRRELEWTNATNRPRDGFPEHMEASWEDIGEHGRFLDDLGGMSVAMREQMFEEFVKALNKPITGTPKAGSIADVIHDLDRWLTQEAKYENIEGSQQD